MLTVFHQHLRELRSLNDRSSPAVSIFVPLRGAEEPAQKVFSGLIKFANQLLKESGHEPIRAKSPSWELLKSQGAATVAIFIRGSWSKLLPLPTLLQPRVVVADSFHIKPVVAAASEYIDALMLHFHPEGATLLEVSPVGEKVIENYIPFPTETGTDWVLKANRNELRNFLEFLLKEIKKHVRSSTKFLGISGGTYDELKPPGLWGQTGVEVVLTEDPFATNYPKLGVGLLHEKIVKFISNHHIELLASKETKSPDDFGLLVKKIIEREISFLIISLEDMAFGKIDQENGAIIMTQNQSDSKDDDLLDDLLELAMDFGISVSVVPKKFLPKGKTYIAY